MTIRKTFGRFDEACGLDASESTRLPFDDPLIPSEIGYAAGQRVHFRREWPDQGDVDALLTH